jgi:hypothetical protein
MAPVTFKAFCMVDADAIDNEPPEIPIAAWLPRLLTESDADELCVMVMSENPITTLSPGPGTPPFHIAGLSQSPLTSLAQVMVESSVLSSTRSQSNRNRLRVLQPGRWRGRRGCANREATA